MIRPAKTWTYLYKLKLTSRNLQIDFHNCWRDLIFRSMTSLLTSMHILKIALLGFLSIHLFLNSPAMGSQESELKTVLILYSLSYAYPAVVGWDQSIRSVFMTQQDINIKVNTEHLDLSRYNDSDYIQMMVDIFRHKYL